MKNLLFFLSISFLLFLLPSCKGKKFIGVEKTEELPLDSLLSALENHNLDFDWFDAKAKIKFESPEESGSATCRIRIKKDSVIWMNFKKLGVEASRVLIRPDSFFIIYRLEKSFERGSISDIRRIYEIPINFDWIQQMVFGNLPIPTAEDESVLLEDSSYYHLRSSLPDYYADYILAGDLTVFQVKLEDQQERVVSLDFSDYKYIQDSLKFAYLRQYQIPLENGADIIARFDFSNVVLNVPKAIKFKIPDSYKELL